MEHSSGRIFCFRKRGGEGFSERRRGIARTNRGGLRQAIKRQQHGKRERLFAKGRPLKQERKSSSCRWREETGDLSETKSPERPKNEKGSALPSKRKRGVSRRTEEEGGETASINRGRSTPKNKIMEIFFKKNLGHRQGKKKNLMTEEGEGGSV